MPYGKDFLDAVNDILMDNRQSSRRIKHNCRLCNKEIGPEDEEWMFMGGVPFAVNELGFGTMKTICSACTKAKI